MVWTCQRRRHHHTAAGCRQLDGGRGRCRPRRARPASAVAAGCCVCRPRGVRGGPQPSLRRPPPQRHHHTSLPRRFAVTLRCGGCCSRCTVVRPPVATAVRFLLSLASLRCTATRAVPCVVALCMCAYARVRVCVCVCACVLICMFFVSFVGRRVLRLARGRPGVCEQRRAMARRRSSWRSWLPFMGEKDPDKELDVSYITPRIIGANAWCCPSSIARVVRHRVVYWCAGFFSSFSSRVSLLLLQRRVCHGAL